MFKKIFTLIILFSCDILSVNYYISQTSGDDNRTTSTNAAPWKTIQKAASVAIAGDTIFIKAGTYRETVTPTNSGTQDKPIVFVNYQNDSVYISATELITGWTLHQGAIYKAPMNWDLGLGKNQIFLNGKNILEARYPNMNPDKYDGMLTKTFINQSFRAVNGNPTGNFASGYKLVDSKWRKPDNFWKDAMYVCYRPGDSWIATTGTITSSKGDSIWVKGSYEWFKYGLGQGWIGGNLNCLDSENEWAYSNGFLYLWAPGGVNPSSLKIEAKKRNLAFNLDDRTNIVINGITGISNSISFTKSQNCTVENSNFFYGAHFTLLSYDTIMQKEVASGVRSIFYAKNASHILIKNCEIGHVGGSVFWEAEGSSNNRVTDCLIYDFNTCGGQMVGISPWVWAPKPTFRLDHNTMFNAGHHCAAAIGTFEYNIFHDYCILGDDCGGFYTWGNDGKYSRIQYNWFYNNFTTFLGGHIYFDDGASQYVAHHNVIWNGIGTQQRPYALRGNNLHVSYNTVVTPYRDTSDILKDAQGRTVGLYDIYQTKQQLTANYWKFKDPLHYDYTLTEGSPAIDKGIKDSLTEFVFGAAPDMGAYEYGLPPWRPGRHTGPEYCVQPEITPHRGFVASTSVKIETITSGATIYYTLDGSIPTDKSQKYNVPFTITSSFGKQVIVRARAYKAGLKPSNPSTPATFEDLRPAETVTGDKPGLEVYKYSTTPPHWSEMPDFSTMQSKGTCIVPNFMGRNDGVSAANCLSVNEGNKEILGAHFKGFINIPADGEYTFTLRTYMTDFTRGQQMFIGGRLVVDGDYPNFFNESSGSIGLKKGKHRVEFKLRTLWNDERTSLVWYQGPGFAQRLVPDSAFTYGGTVSTYHNLIGHKGTHPLWFSNTTKNIMAGFSLQEKHNFKVFTIDGKLLFSHMGFGPATYNLTKLVRFQPGTYILQMQSGSMKAEKRLQWLN